MKGERRPGDESIDHERELLKQKGAHAVEAFSSLEQSVRSKIYPLPEDVALRYKMLQVRRTQRGTRIDLILAAADAIDTVRPVGFSHEAAQLELIGAWLTERIGKRFGSRILCRVAMWCARRLYR